MEILNTNIPDIKLIKQFRAEDARGAGFVHITVSFVHITVRAAGTCTQQAKRQSGRDQEGQPADAKRDARGKRRSEWGSQCRSAAVKKRV